MAARASHCFIQPDRRNKDGMIVTDELLQANEAYASGKLDEVT